MERNKSPNKKKTLAASALLCAKKTNKRKRFNSPLKRGNISESGASGGVNLRWKLRA